MIVAYAPEADRDPESIGDYIAIDNPARAASFVGELRERGLSLTDHPERFQQVGTAAGHALRKLTHGDYLIFYVVTSSGVRVLRVIHAARDWANIVSE